MCVVAGHPAGGAGSWQGSPRADGAAPGTAAAGTGAGAGTGTGAATGTGAGTGATSGAGAGAARTRTQQRTQAQVQVCQPALLPPSLGSRWPAARSTLHPGCRASGCPRTVTADSTRVMSGPGARTRCALLGHRHWRLDGRGHRDWHTDVGRCWSRHCTPGSCLRPSAAVPAGCERPAAWQLLDCSGCRVGKCTRAVLRLPRPAPGQVGGSYLASAPGAPAQA